MRSKHKVPPQSGFSKLVAWWRSQLVGALKGCFSRWDNFLYLELAKGVISWYGLNIHDYPEGDVLLPSCTGRRNGSHNGLLVTQPIPGIGSDLVPGEVTECVIIVCCNSSCSSTLRNLPPPTYIHVYASSMAVAAFCTKLWCNAFIRVACISTAEWLYSGQQWQIRIWHFYGHKHWFRSFCWQLSLGRDS